MCDWVIRDSIYHKTKPTCISSFGDVIINKHLDISGNRIKNCPTLNNKLQLDKQKGLVLYPEGSILALDRTNKSLGFTGIVHNKTDNILNLGQNKIVNLSAINYLEFKAKCLDLNYKRLSNIGRPKFLNDAVSKGYLEELLRIQNDKIKDLESRLSRLEKL